MPTEERPWGSFTVLHKGEGFLVKTLVVHPGGSTSLQTHAHRREDWVLVSGQALIRRGHIVRHSSKGDHWHIPVGMLHRITNPSHTTPLVMVETQIGECSEEDIIRYEDEYGRVPQERAQEALPVLGQGKGASGYVPPL